MPQAHFGPIKVPDGTPDEHFIYLSDVLPTTWQAVEYADIPRDDSAHERSIAVFGLGPIRQMSARIARQRGTRVIAMDLVPERFAMAERHGIEVLNLKAHDNIADTIRQMTPGRGTNAVIDAVGMEAHGAPVRELAQKMTSLLPDSVTQPLMRKAGIDRMAVLTTAIDTVRRGGTLSIIAVYGGMLDPMPMMVLFDKQIQLRMGQANVKRWVDDLMPFLTDSADPLGVEDLATHKLPLAEGPGAYAMFQHKKDGAVKILLKP